MTPPNPPLDALEWGETPQTPPLREPRNAKTLRALEWGETPQTPPLRETRYAKTLNSPFRMVIFDTQSPRCARGLDYRLSEEVRL